MCLTRKDKKWKSQPRAIQLTPARVEHAKMKMEHVLVKNSEDGVTEGFVRSGRWMRLSRLTLPVALIKGNIQ